MKQRRKNLLRYAAEAGCDILVTTEPENLFYMTGFWGEALGVLEKNGKTTIIAPELEAGRAKDESSDCTVVTAQRGMGLISTLAELVKSRACTDCQDYSTMNTMKRLIPKIKHAPELFEHARIIKDTSELKILKKASRIIDDMFELCAKEMHAGQKESELQATLMSYAAGREMFDTGYNSTLNPLIIAGGPNGALPHAQVTSRKFKRRDLVVVDLTLRHGGYVSDATRTFAIGRITSNMSDAYEIVKESQDMGLQKARPGVKCSDVDHTCRKFIQERGFGKYFIHSTGHGIGLQVHEEPSISSRSKTVLEKDMAITVEPGIYVPSSFGVRIEDSIIVRDRPISMHKFTKDLVVV